MHSIKPFSPEIISRNRKKRYYSTCCKRSSNKIKRYVNKFKYIS